jgi:hypothetical protein
MSNADAHGSGAHGARSVPELAAHPVPGAPTDMHEGSEPNLRPILGFAISLAVLCAVAMLLMRVMFVAEIDTRRGDDPVPTPLSVERQVPPEPRLQSLQGVPLSSELSTGPVPEDAEPFQTTSLNDFDHKARATLGSYGWVDRQAGVVHVPIERAIELVLKNGLPTSAPKTDKR